jgi:DNA-binding transcriptional ArsR family regulator
VARHPWDGDPAITGEHEVDIGLKRKTAGEPFLKGPILLRQLTAACQLPGRALALLLLVHHRTDIEGKAWITLPGHLLASWGIDRDANRRALRQLEGAGLVRLDRRKGYRTRVRLLPMPKKRGSE